MVTASTSMTGVDDVVEMAIWNVESGDRSNRHLDLAGRHQSHLVWAEDFDILLEEDLWAVDHCEVAVDLLSNVLVVEISRMLVAEEQC